MLFSKQRRPISSPAFFFKPFFSQTCHQILTFQPGGLQQSMGETAPPVIYTHAGAGRSLALKVGWKFTLNVTKMTVPNNCLILKGRWKEKTF